MALAPQNVFEVEVRHSTTELGGPRAIYPETTLLCDILYIPGVSWSLKVLQKMGISTCFYRVMSHFLRYLKSGPSRSKTRRLVPGPKPSPVVFRSTPFLTSF